MMFAITAITAHAVEAPNFVIIYADDLGTRRQVFR